MTGSSADAPVESATRRHEASIGAQADDHQNGNLSCSFCGKSQKEVKKLIAGPDRLHLRRVHRALQRHHRGGGREGRAVRRLRPRSRSPSEIKAILDDYVIGQERAKKILAVAVHNHYKRIDSRVSARRRRAREVEHPAPRADRHAARRSSRRRSRRSSTCRSRSPTRRRSPRPATSARTSRTSSSSSCRTPITTSSARSAASSTSTRSTRSAARATTRASRATCRARACSRRSSRSSRARSRTCRRRAAASTRSRISCRSTRRTSSSSAAAPSSASTRSSSGASGSRRSASAPTSRRKKDYKLGELLEQVQPEDLLKFGLIPEFIGRLPVLATLHELNEDALIDILTKPKNALVKQYQKLFEMDGVKLQVHQGRARRPSRARRSSATAGARGLRAILEHAMLDIMYDIPSRSGHQGGRRQRGRRSRSASRRSSSTRRKPSWPEAPRSRERCAVDRVCVADAVAAVRRVSRPPRSAASSRARDVLQERRRRKGACPGEEAHRPAASAAGHHRVPAHGRRSSSSGASRSIDALDEAMARDKDIFLAAQKNAKTNEPTPEDIFAVGTLGTIDAAAPPARRHREGARRGQAPRAHQALRPDRRVLPRRGRRDRRGVAARRRGRGADAQRAGAPSRST